MIEKGQQCNLAVDDIYTLFGESLLYSECSIKVGLRLPRNSQYDVGSEMVQRPWR